MQGQTHKAEKYVFLENENIDHGNSINDRIKQDDATKLGAEVLTSQHLAILEADAPS